MCIRDSTRRGEEIVSGTEPASITWDGTTGTDIIGNHTISIRIDPLDDISEWNEWDNNFTFQLVVLESKPDINVYDIFVIDQAVRGMPSDIIITLFNKGSSEIFNCPIELRIEGEIIDNWNLNLGEGEFYNITGEYAVSYTHLTLPTILLV